MGLSPGDKHVDKPARVREEQSENYYGRKTGGSLGVEREGYDIQSFDLERN